MQNGGDTYDYYIRFFINNVKISKIEFDFVSRTQNSGSPDLRFINACDLQDIDNDGIPNRLDTDSDGDGCSDALEAGFTDADEDGELDGTGYDTDGKVTGGDGYTTPADTDSSGTADYLESGVDEACNLIPDTDTDGDGIPDVTDLDDDNDGILDTNEGDDTIDTDGDGIPDNKDTDSDGDGCSDAKEAGYADADENGIVDGSITTFFFAEDPVATFHYPLFATAAEANFEDIKNGGTGTSHTHTYTTDTSNTSWYMPDTGNHMSDTTAPVNANGITYNTAVSINANPVTSIQINANGTVAGSDGYTTTADVDNSGTADHLEAAVATACIPDSDGDGINDVDDIDDDNDGILDVDEGFQPTINIDINNDSDAIAAKSEVASSKNQESAASNQTGTGIDTDGDGIEDHLDIDSDGDGCNDVIEAGYTDANGDGQVDGTGINPDGTVSNSDGYGSPLDLDNNNIADHFESGPDMNNNGTPDGCDTDDNDGDGIPDVIDADDDNDGISDIAEGSGDTDNDGTPDYLDLDSDNDGIFDVNESGYGANDTNNDGMIDSNDSNFADTNSDGHEDTLATATPRDHDNDGIADHLDLDSDNDGNYDNVESGNGNLDTNGDGMVDANDAVFADANNNGTADATENTTPLDTDGDGIADHLDLDSDNDGVYDVVEGGDGNLDSNGDGMLNSTDTSYQDIDTDGMFDTSEITDPTDTDTDGTPDYIDSDSDNDGCFDTSEAGFTDLEDDGKLGGTPITVDAMGKVTTNVDGYTTPKDGDSNNITDYQEVGSDPVLLANASDVNVEEEQAAVFTVNVTSSKPVSFQWQVSTNAGSTWVNLSEDTLHSGTTTNELTIAETTMSMDGYKYQALISMETFACGTLTSDPPVLLTVTEKAMTDTDNDGVADVIDVDADNDGILNVDEGDSLTDTDNDGVPNYLDTDSDGDGCSDAIEAGFTDANADGMVDGNGTDTDGKVIGSDGYTIPADVNNNGVFDAFEVGPDSDNDGTVDACDNTVDTDNDGIDDSVDVDDDNDGIYDTAEGSGDTDGDGIPDSRDTDSDNDGCSDAKEAGFTDANADGMVDGTGVAANGAVIGSDGYTNPADARSKWRCRL